MFKNELEVEIISPEGMIYKDSVNEIILYSIQGQLTILPSHAPLFTKLVEGEVILRKGSQSVPVKILGGFLEVINNRVNILADHAQMSKEMTEKEISEAKKKAEVIAQLKINGENFILERSELSRAFLDMKVADKLRKKPRKM